MPIYIKQDAVKFRQLQGNQYTGNYYGVDTISDTTTEEKVAEINSAASSAMNNINNTANSAISNINTASNAAKAQANTLNANVQTIANAIEHAEGNGVDPNLTLPNVAAEAKATGDAIGELKSAITDIRTSYTNVFDVSSALAGKRPPTTSITNIDITDDSALNTNMSYETSACISCQPGDVFTVNNTGSGSNIWYGNSNGKYFSSQGTVGTTFTIPDDVYYFRFVIKISGIGAFDPNQFMIIKGTSLPDHYIPFGTKQTLNEDIIIPQLEDYETVTDAATHATKTELATAVSDVENQISDVESRVSGIITTYDNVFNKNTALTGKRPKTSGTWSLLDDTALNANNSYATSAAISCNPGDVFTVNNTGSGSNVWWGDSDGNYLSQSTVTSTFTIPDTVYYFRFVIKILGEGAFSPDDFMIIKGASLPDHYVPYGNERILNENIMISPSSIGAAMDSLRADGDEIVAHIPNATGSTVHDATVRLCLHRGNAVGEQDWNELFSPYINDGAFSSLRIVDDSGKNLPYDVMCHGNYDFVKDKHFFGGVVLKLSDGSLIHTVGGNVCRSTDNGNTWTQIASLKGTAVMVDHNDNIFYEFAHILRRALAPDYTTVEVVLDYQATNSTVRPNSIREDDSGNVFCGIYQSEFLVRAYRMLSGENAFTECFSLDEGQHVHCISVNRNTTPNEIYIGVDAGNYSKDTWCWRSTDSGSTWTRLNIPDRASDHGYVYFGNGFALGCGETNLKGGSTIYRSTDVTDPTKCTPVVSTLGGMRMIQSPKDGLIVAYACAGGTNKIEQYYQSVDNGLTWDCIYANDLAPLEPEISGNGIRYVTPYFTPMGDTENQVIGTGFGMDYAVRCYFGGNRYSGIVYAKVGDVPVGGKTIRIKTGYLVDHSNESDTRTAYSDPIFEINPIGDNKIQTTNGEVTTAGYTVQNGANTIRYGGILGSMLRNTIGAEYVPGYNAIGDIGLRSNTNITIAFYINFPTDIDYREFPSFYFLKNASDTFRVGYSNTGGNIRLRVNGKLYGIGINKAALYANGYALITVSIIKTGSAINIKVYAPDDEAAYESGDVSANWGEESLGAENWYFGNDGSVNTFGISNVMVFDRALTADEATSLYHGRNYYAGKQVYTSDSE